MKALLAATLFLTASVCAQNSTTPGQMRKQVFQNDRLTAYAIDIVPGQSSPMHRHEHDMLTVSVTDGMLKITNEGSGPAEIKPKAGDVHFQPGGFSHAVENAGKTDFRAVDIEFATSQGKQEPPAHKKTHYCNPGSKDACVTERYLFCTTKFCVEDVTMAPGAKSTQHSHDTEHMLVAISDYSLADDTTGKGVIQREVKSGGVEYLPAGITHVLTNTGKDEAKFIAIIFK